jgi:hypothetical protein
MMCSTFNSWRLYSWMRLIWQHFREIAHRGGAQKLGVDRGNAIRAVAADDRQMRHARTTWTLVRKTQQRVLRIDPHAVDSPETQDCVRVFRYSPVGNRLSSPAYT